ncbi:MAG: M28 family peptidase [Vicinamibacterales bacterium]
MTRSCQALAPLIFVCVASSCARERPIFSEQNARAHVNMLAGTIGSRPAGTESNRRARTYIIEQLKQSGFEVRVQETDARRRDLGRTARVSNIIAVLRGERTEAVGLLSHYDSVFEAPGAGDDALGVAVSLEGARVLAAQKNRRWSLLVVMTDAEESGLMGAAALVGERDIVDRLKAYVNVEAIGTDGVPVLFETGPGNGWLTSVWARRAPHPRGGSYGIEVYKRLPNDTDFSILKTHDIPGLNFAAVGDSYAYHTPRDTAERLSARALRTMGENLVAILQGLQGVDITQRSPLTHTYFDIGGTTAVSYGPAAGMAIGVAALLLGFIAWWRFMRAVMHSGGFLRWLLVALWTLVAAAAVAATMVATVWLLRAAREAYHPWYAHPGRLVTLLVVTGTAAGWTMARFGRLLPARAHSARHPALTWSLALPVWIALSGIALWMAPSAAYLWTLPLLSAGILFCVLPPAIDGVVRVASAVMFAIAATVWLRESLELFWFTVAVLGRMPIVTPSFVYPALVGAAGLMLAPPLIATVTPAQPLLRPSVLTTMLLIAVSVTAGLAYNAPAYTSERPLRRHVRMIQDGAAAQAVWEVGSVEPGLDLGDDAPRGFMPVSDEAAGLGIPWGRLTFPFVFRTTAAAPGPPPATISNFTSAVLDQGVEASVTVTPQQPGVIVTFVLPETIVPARSNLPGIIRRGRWSATYVAPPPDGVSWRASFARMLPNGLDGLRIVATLPWGEHPPAWLPQDRSVWSGAATWVLTPPAPIVAAAPLR